MSKVEQIDPQVIQKTKDTLRKVISKPALTDKLLNRPPFRYLHDILTEVIRATGFLEGLYSADELNITSIQDKEQKMAFLQKAIDATSLWFNVYMKNLIYHFPTCYAYSVKKPIGEVNLKRALDEDTGVFNFILFLSFIFFSTGSCICIPLCLTRRTSCANCKRFISQITIGKDSLKYIRF